MSLTSSLFADVSVAERLEAWRERSGQIAGEMENLSLGSQQPRKMPGVGPEHLQPQYSEEKTGESPELAGQSV